MLTFLEITLTGWGGMLALARRIMVERRGWLTDREFAETLGLCQVLPGGNIVNLAVTIGGRARGPLGAAAALAGLLVAPLLIVILIGMLYAEAAQHELVREALRGAATATAGLMLATGLKLAQPYRRQPAALLMAGLAFVAVGLLRWPLVPVLLGLAPVSILLAWRRGQATAAQHGR